MPTDITFKPWNNNKHWQRVLFQLARRPFCEPIKPQPLTIWAVQRSAVNKSTRCSTWFLRSTNPHIFFISSEGPPTFSYIYTPQPEMLYCYNIICHQQWKDLKHFLTSSLNKLISLLLFRNGKSLLLWGHYDHLCCRSTLGGHHCISSGQCNGAFPVNGHRSCLLSARLRRCCCILSYCLSSCS